MAEQYLYLTTTGWKSGDPHEIEIWFVEYEDAYYLVSERHEKAHWVQNIQHNSKISWRVGDEQFDGRGRAVDDSDAPTLTKAVKALMDEKYNWSSGLVVELKANDG